MKEKGLSISTSFVAALVCIILLKIIDLFHFIKWSPIGYTEQLQTFDTSHTFVKWAILFIVIWCICIVFYYISLVFIKVPISISSLALGIIIATALEWVILDENTFEKTIKHMSIPFMCIIVILVRFMMESAIFHAQDHPLNK
ncbi:hypothetical protein [Psychrobacillus vulpis]|uniref:Uncharacterized protein n=1 Tax=Psychrobacillus vulpis TaxID=2325572 RepID=A0A544TQ35_9BACI|nr:hypothetical protein [Psychrobacillus vulpis]TQR19567.1 hypothetical protein FG384_11595 [Psychrobacillus vulpis]